MAHFAELNQDSKVINVIYLDNQYLLDENGNESEELGIQYLKTHHGDEKTWIKTSINNNIRGHYAVMDGYYLPEIDQFTSRKTYDSWVLSGDNYTWTAPVSMPTDASEGFFYNWNESSLSWVLEEFPKPPPKEITSNSFRSQLTLTEKLLWDSPDTAETPTQKAALITFQNELPLTEETEELNELLDLLVSAAVFTQQRLDEIISAI